MAFPPLLQFEMHWWLACCHLFCGDAFPPNTSRTSPIHAPAHGRCKPRMSSRTARSTSESSTSRSRRCAFRQFSATQLRRLLAFRQCFSIHKLIEGTCRRTCSLSSSSISPSGCCITRSMTSSLEQ